MINVDFISKRKIYYTISLSLIVIGILVTVIFHPKVDIQFAGGTTIRYEYSGNLSKEQITNIESIASKTLNFKVNAFTEKLPGGTNQDIVLESIASTKDLTLTKQAQLFTDLSKAYKSNSFKNPTFSAVSNEMGAEFFWQSFWAVMLASALIILYIWFRFRKIGGLPAGITAFIALLHDVIMAFVAFSIFRIAINDNFIAVALTILGYSINDTIVVYDRVRENRQIYGTKMTFKDIVNKSINQTFSRSINTVLVTFVAIAIICVFAIVNNLESIRSFALPMMVGVATGAYSTICIAGPLWVTWEDYKTNKEKKLKEQKLLAKAAKSSSK